MSQIEMMGDELRQGIAALKAGRRAEARQLLIQAVSANPKDAAAWLWLSRCVDDADRRQECLERALHLAPADESARRALWKEKGAQLRRIVGAGVSPPSNQAFHGMPVLRGLAPPRGAPAGRLTADRQWLTADAAHGTPHATRHTHHAPRTTPHASRLRFDAQRRRLLLSTVALAVIALACALAPRIGWLASEAQPAGGEALEASGIIRAEEVLVASEWGGQIAAIPVDEGDSVAVGDVVVQLDTVLLDAQIGAVQAAVALAETRLAQAKAGPRPGQIAVAEAQLAQTKAARLAALQAVSDTLALVENPQEVRLQIAVKQAQAEAAQRHVARAVIIKDAAEIGKDKFEAMQGKWYEGGHRKVLIGSGPVSELSDILPPEIVVLLPTLGDGVHNFGELELHLHGETYDLYARISVRDIPIPFELHLMPNQWWQAWVGINAAVAQQEGIEASLAHLYGQRAHPQSLEAMADEALAQTEAQIAAAQAWVDGLKAGPTEEQVAALEARVVQAQAALDSLLTQRGMMTLVSPVDGTVVNIVAHPGEVAVPGASLLTVADLGQVSLVVYVPETALGRVRLSQRVGVTVDSFEGRIFEGRVTRIADRAEFRPRNVATKEERVNLVFAVEIQLANDDRALKPGMPADAVFGE